MWQAFLKIRDAPRQQALEATSSGAAIAASAAMRSVTKEVAIAAAAAALELANSGACHLDHSLAQDLLLEKFSLSCETKTPGSHSSLYVVCGYSKQFRKCHKHVLPS